MKMLMEPIRHVTSVKTRGSSRMEVVRRIREPIAECSLQRLFVKSAIADSLCRRMENVPEEEPNMMPIVQSVKFLVNINAVFVK